MTALLVGLVVIAAIWWTLAHAPVVDPYRCPHGAIRSGREECGGPCKRGRLPCEEESA